MRTNLKYLVAILAIASVFALVIQACNNEPKTDRHQSQENIWKEKLSEYNFFAGDLKGMKPHEGVYPYNIVTPLFTDYAVKDRFIHLPAGTKISYTEDGVLDFPDSTFLIKSFGYINKDAQKVLIETRLMFKEASGNWDVMNYLWNDEQTDAVKHIIGSRVPITLLDNEGKTISTVYQVPNVNECKRCHINEGKLIPIGPKARNLNYTLAGESTNQLAKWTAQGILAGMPELEQVERLPDWQDGKHYTIAERARAYLDVNCSYCHTKGGDAYNTGLFLEYDQQDPNHIGIMKLPVSAGGGAGGLNYDIVPGNADSSVLHFRMNSTMPGTAMPELTRTVIHKEGVRLIRDWINGMQ